MCEQVGKNITPYKLLDMEKCVIDSLIGKQYQSIINYFENRFSLKDILYLHNHNMFAVNLSLDISQDLYEIKKLEVEKQNVLAKMTIEKLKEDKNGVGSEKEES